MLFEFYKNINYLFNLLIGFIILQINRKHYLKMSNLKFAKYKSFNQFNKNLEFHEEKY